uniref:Hemin import ATP-binding protein hmuV n=1 Tax=Magnetococcus massalia (strain MO-1) TaxID=451514 RepID=A0A1S7LMU5_MAGMO|nr:Hemin import ATP-binding protein hmuV [Candidatus Magnetococcus massalia]
MKPLLSLHHATIEIGEKRICSGFDLTLHAGESVAILGRNGVGKSTLLRAMMGLHPLQAGEVVLGDQPLTQWRSRARAKQIGMLFQQQAFELPTTVAETVMLGRHPHIATWGWEGEADRQRVNQALEAVDLTSLAHRSIAALSGGERRRVEIAMLLAQAPRLMLLDEPVNHLDLPHQVQVLQHMRSLTQAGQGVVMVMHDINLTLRMADRLLLMIEPGEVVDSAPEALDAALLTRVLGQPMEAINHQGETFWQPGFR